MAGLICIPVLKALRRSTDGAITVELAAVLSVFVLLALGAYDFGRLGLRQARLTSAVNAGAQYGMQGQSAAGDLGEIVAIVREEAGDAEGSLEVTARQYCSCPGGGETTCSGTCSDGKYPPLYLQINAADQTATLFNYPGLPQIFSLSAESLTRVR